MTRMRCIKTSIGALGALLLVGCSTLSPYSSQTKLQLTLQSSEYLNLDINGRASPLVLRLYELKHPAAFESTDFFSLYERGKEVLGPDLVNSEELELRPGQNLELKLTVGPDSRYVGLLAAYRDLSDTRWRYVIGVRAQELTRVALTLDETGIDDAADSLPRETDRP